MNPRRVARVSVADGLQAGRMAINARRLRQLRSANWGLNGLRNYRREWDDERKTFRDLPLKDWAEHIGSAWRYLGLCWKEITPPKEKKAAPKQLEYTVQPDGTDSRQYVGEGSGGPDGEASENDG
jgi:phage terminase large subunit